MTLEYEGEGNNNEIADLLIDSFRPLYKILDKLFRISLDDIESLEVQNIINALEHITAVCKIIAQIEELHGYFSE